MSTFIELTQVSSFLGIRLGASFFHGFGRYRVRRGREVAYATVVHFDRQWLDPTFAGTKVAANTRRRELCAKSG